MQNGGTRWRSWLRHRATNWKVAGSIPDGVTGIFHWPHYGPGVDSASNRNEYLEYFLRYKGDQCARMTTLPPSYFFFIGRIMALGSTQLLTEMSTWNISWGIKATSVQGWQPYRLHMPNVSQSGSLRACYRPLFIIIIPQTVAICPKTFSSRADSHC